jgi:hypothetical protein
MVTILSKPYTSQSINLNGVYNGLSFVLNSGLKGAPNFKYICEVYYNNQKVTELRHHPDISSDKKGVFEVGRIIENYMNFNYNILNKFASYPGNDSVNKYHCVFGEEYSRFVRFVSSSNSSGSLRLTSQLELSNGTGDWMFISGSNIQSYNGWKRITQKIGSVGVILNTPWSGVPNVSGDMYAIQGTNILGFYKETLNGTDYLALKIPIPVGTSPILYNMGDRVYVDSPLTPASLPQFYKNTEWTVMKTPYRPTPTTSHFVVILSAPYKFSVGSGVSGSMMSKDNFVFKSQVSTVGDNSHAWNGVRQYEQESLLIDGTPSDTQWQTLYKRAPLSPPLQPTQYMKTFSDKPTKTYHICANEVYQLQSMGSWLNKVNSADNNKETHIRVETWGSDISTLSGGEIIQSSGIVGPGMTLTYKTTSNTSQFSPGDYVTLSLPNPGGFSVSCRVVRTNTLSGFNYIHTNGVATGSGTASIAQTIKVRYKDVLLQTGSQVIPCGTWNLSELPSFASVYKYFVYPIVPVGGSYWSPNGGLSTGSDNNGINYTGDRVLCGEKWEFIIDDVCCSDMPTYKVMWLNKQGGFDFYKFTKRSDKKLNIVRSGFDRKLKSVNPTTNIYGYKSGSRGTQNYNVDSRESILLNSDFLSQTELDWLINIYESPEVYIVKDGITKPYILPVSVKRDEVVHPNKRFRMEGGSSLYTYQLELEMATARVIQRGAPVSYEYTVRVPLENISYYYDSIIM